jgi:hypothetical protein
LYGTQQYLTTNTSVFAKRYDAALAAELESETTTTTATELDPTDIDYEVRAPIRLLAQLFVEPPTDAQHELQMSRTTQPFGLAQAARKMSFLWPGSKATNPDAPDRDYIAYVTTLYINIVNLKSPRYYVTPANRAQLRFTGEFGEDQSTKAQRDSPRFPAERRPDCATKERATSVHGKLKHGWFRPGTA